MLLSRVNKRHFLQSLLRHASATSTTTSTTNTSTIILRSLSSAPTSSPTSFSHDKIETDERYASSAEVPESLTSNNQEESEFSIRGKFKEGRAAYLDMSATTPLDPRVFDKMAPYMVSYSQEPRMDF